MEPGTTTGSNVWISMCQLSLSLSLSRLNRFVRAAFGSRVKTRLHTLPLAISCRPVLRCALNFVCKRGTHSLCFTATRTTRFFLFFSFFLFWFERHFLLVALFPSRRVAAWKRPSVRRFERLQPLCFARSNRPILARSTREYFVKHPSRRACRNSGMFEYFREL